MSCEKLRGTLFPVLLLFFVAVGGGFGQFADPPGGAGDGAAAAGPDMSNIPPEVLELVRLQIEAELRRAYDRLVIEKELATSWGLAYPVEDPVRDIAAVERLVEKELTDLAQKQYPSSLRDQFMVEAEEEYRVWQRGSKITITLTDGTEVEGNYRGVENRAVVIDNRRFKVTELSQNSLDHLFPSFAEKAKKDYIRHKLQQLEADRDRYKSAMREVTEHRLFDVAGYIQVSGEWLTKSQYFADRLEKEKERLREYLVPALRDTFMYERGYVRYGDAWVSLEEAAVIRKKEKFDENDILQQFAALDRDEIMVQAAPAPVEEGGFGGDPGFMPGPDAGFEPPPPEMPPPEPPAGDNLQGAPFAN